MEIEILALTYNVGNGRADPNEIANLVQKNRADIIGFQELSDDQAKTIDKNLITDYPTRILFPGGFAGKGILSRYPVINVSQVNLGPERPDLLVTLDVNGSKLSVITGHPPPPRFRKSGFSFDHSTRNQIKALASLAIENKPAILMGDFNFVSSSKEYTLVKNEGLTDAFKAAGRGAGFTLPRRLGPWRRFQWLNRLLSWIPLLPIARVDYIWFTQPLTCRRCWVGMDAGSDHLPVLANLAIT